MSPTVCRCRCELGPSTPASPYHLPERNIQAGLPAKLVLSGWLSQRSRGGGLCSAADPHPSRMPSHRREPRSPGSLGAGLLCRFADPPPRERWLSLTAVPFSRASPLSQTAPRFHRACRHRHSPATKARSPEGRTQSDGRSEPCSRTLDIILPAPSLATRQAPGPRLAVQRHKRPAPSAENDLRHFSERGNRGAAQVSRRTARRGAGAGQNQQSKGVGVFQRGFAGKPAPTFRTGASPWGAAPRGCRSICHAAHPRSHRYSAKDNPRPARRTPARPIPSATHPAAATSARQRG